MTSADGDAPKDGDAHDDGVGSVGEEAVKLFAALSESLGSLGSLGPLAAGGSLEEHLATGAPECRLCPICRTVHVIREAGPEVRVHLASAAASLMQAAAGLLAAAAAEPGAASPQPGGVQHIDLDDDQTATAEETP